MVPKKVYRLESFYEAGQEASLEGDDPCSSPDSDSLAAWAADRCAPLGEGQQADRASSQVQRQMDCRWPEVAEVCRSWVLQRLQEQHLHLMIFVWMPGSGPHVREPMTMVSGSGQSAVGDLARARARRENVRVAGRVQSTSGSVDDLAQNTQQDAQVDRTDEVSKDDALKAVGNLHRRSSQGKLLPS